MMNSKNFNPHLFRILVESWEEGPRLDYKQEVYNFDDEKKKFEFLKDLIAFSNIARRTGKPCWILFGVQEFPAKKLFDVKNQHPAKKTSANWNDPAVSMEYRQRNDVEARYTHLAQEWIEPTCPDFSLEFGLLDEVFVSYLEIIPQQSSHPFFLRRDCEIRGWKRGTVFIRKNSSSLMLEPSEVKYLSQVPDVAYLKKKDWKSIVQKCQVGDFETMSNSLIPFIEIMTRGEPNITAIDAVEKLLEENEKVIIVVGNGGEGKTVLLHRLAYKLAGRNNFDTVREYFGQNETGGEIVKSVFDELEVILPNPVPLYFSLRTYFDTEENLENKIFKQISEAIGDDKKNLTLKSLFNIPGSKWVILLDGLDEIWVMDKAAPILEAWARDLPDNVQVVLTSRPNALPEFDEYKKVHLQSLAKDDVLYYLGETVRRESETEGSMFYNELENILSSSKETITRDLALKKLVNKIQVWLEDNEKLYSLIKNLRALAGFLFAISSFKPTIKPSIDQDIIDPVIAEDQPLQTTPLTTEINVPIIDVEKEVLESEDISVKKRLDEKESIGEWTLPKLATTIQSITDYLQQEEVKRQSKWGTDPKRVADLARLELGKTAWYIRWEDLCFEYLKCRENGWISDDSNKWNENIGHIHRAEDGNNYRFCSEVFRRYMSAEFAFKYKEDKKEEIIDYANSQNGGNQATAEVIQLLNELFEENGRETIVI